MSSCCGFYFQWKSGRSNGKAALLKELGIDAIELMPVQEFAGNDSWGYNTGLYFALDASYGTQNEYKAFIDACHQNGIAVIFDVVYNHTNNDNPFARMYWDTFNNRPSTKNPWLNAVTPHQKYVFHRMISITLQNKQKLLSNAT